MNLLRSTSSKVVAVVAGAALAGGGITAALAAASGPTPAVNGAPAATAALSAAGAPAPGQTPPSPAKPRPGARPMRRAPGLLARSDHATVEVKRKGAWVTLTYDRGKVQAVSAASITLLRPDGQTATLKLDSSTRYRGVSGEPAVAKDRPAAVLSENGTALWVAQGKPRPPRPGAANPGTANPGAANPGAATPGNAPQSPATGKSATKPGASSAA